MASVAEIQQQLVQSHDQVNQLLAEVKNLDAKVTDLHVRSTSQQSEITNLRAANAQLANERRHGGEDTKPLTSLINAKSMAPKVFGGKSEESYRTWTKKVRAFCNASRPGFKKFLLWCEKQQAEIDPEDMDIEWRHKDAAAEVLFDFLVLHTSDDAQILVERFEDNGPEAWRQLARRYDPIGESYVLDQMDKLMHVNRCKSMLELPSSISK